VEKYVLVRNAKLKAMDKLVDKAAANKDRVFRSFTHNFAHNLKQAFINQNILYTQAPQFLSRTDLLTHINISE
jgi:hypothetical protein